MSHRHSKGSDVRSDIITLVQWGDARERERYIGHIHAHPRGCTIRRARESAGVSRLQEVRGNRDVQRVMRHLWSSDIEPTNTRRGSREGK
jgi:hypothetical protein